MLQSFIGNPVIFLLEIKSMFNKDILNVPGQYRMIIRYYDDLQKTGSIHSRIEIIPFKMFIIQNVFGFDLMGTGR